MTTGLNIADRDVCLEVTVWSLAPDLVAASLADIGVLSGGERSRLGRLRRPGDREGYLVAHVQLRRRLSIRLGIPAVDIRFGRLPCPLCGRPNGRPQTEPFAGVEFSVSHTAGLVALALATVAVGVDVQDHPARVPWAVLGGLHRAEVCELLEGPPDRLTERVTRCWVRKEAVLKGTGAGLGHGISDPPMGGGPTPGPVPGWHVHDLTVPTGYAGALAVAAQPPQGRS